jgi:hypothetical protein
LLSERATRFGESVHRAALETGLREVKQTCPAEVARHMQFIADGFRTDDNTRHV